MPAGAGGTVGAAAGALRTGADAAANGAEAGRGALRATSGVAGERLPVLRQLRFARIAGRIQVGGPFALRQAAQRLRADGQRRHGARAKHAFHGCGVVFADDQLLGEGHAALQQQLSTGFARRTVGGAIQRHRVARRCLAQLLWQTVLRRGCFVDAGSVDRGHTRRGVGGRAVGVGDAAIGADHLVQRGSRQRQAGQRDGDQRLAPCGSLESGFGSHRRAASGSGAMRRGRAGGFRPCPGAAAAHRCAARARGRP